MFKKVILFFISLFLCFSCTKKDVIHEKKGSNNGDSFLRVDTITVKELTDDEYQDNPDLEFRHSLYGQFSHSKLLLIKKANGNYDFIFSAGNKKSDEITFSDINIKHFIPIVPSPVTEKDTYLSFIGIINQEWNRHQVRFDSSNKYFAFKNSNESFESKNVTRIDLARNCLNSGLWEIIAYANDGGAVKTYYHGWFDFPQDVYAKEFERFNPKMSYDKLNANLVEWSDPEMEYLNLDVLRIRNQQVDVVLTNLNNQLYPETGARKSKKKNIIYPKDFTIIQDFLTDSTQYATFSPPGCYRKDDPRKTTLGKMSQLVSGKLYQIESNINKKKRGLKEIELVFTDKNQEDTTTLLLGGLDFDKFPTISDSLNHQGYKYPMGIANHSFYETYKEAQANLVEDNPYYGLLYNKQQEWLDSHYFGIDGPLFFWDQNDTNLLHLYILSFERHSYVGHYTFRFTEE